MSTYQILRTDTADSQLRQIILYIAENWGADVALKKMEEIEHQIMALEENPYIGSDPHYRVLRRQGYKVLILEKNLVFYKINDESKEVTIYAIVDQRQDYLNIIRGL
ncbi:type II toxin-antitoxin system RelE/ParE family toxin [Candidatus Merdisoma sp. JLR.KK006]|uniref:type II toxin-antitoxin system RelE/ParE family toxin n=1 Tax=Candidatus Merdisoma sp. JLR.KK006 TaxID=3112626 RepID=UPI002FEF6E6A